MIADGPLVVSGVAHPSGPIYRAKSVPVNPIVCPAGRTLRIAVGHPYPINPAIGGA